MKTEEEEEKTEMRIGFIYWGKMFCSHFMNVCYSDISRMFASQKRALNMRATQPPTQQQQQQTNSLRYELRVKIPQRKENMIIQI